MIAIAAATSQPAGYQPDPNLPPWANGILAIFFSLGGIAGILALLVALKALFKSNEATTVSRVNASNNNASLDRLNTRANHVDDRIATVATAIPPPIAVQVTAPPPESGPPRIQT